MNKKTLFYLLSPLLLMIPAFYNGYPLVYSDTGTYINSGMELILPQDRPIMYGLFIRMFSLGYSLWPIIYFQSLITTYCLWQLTKLSYTKIRPSVFLIFLFMLSCFTGLGWYSSQIMPDIFTITAIISSILLIYPKETTKTHLFIRSVILIFSINTHFSNFPIVIILIFVILIFKRNTLIFKQIKYASIILISSLVVASTTNFVIARTFKISQGSHVFLAGKMLDSGVLKSFLDSHCDKNEYVFCECKDSLPSDSRALFWSSDSPLVKHGGWKGSEKSYTKLLIGIFSSPKHFFLYCYNSLFSSVSQLFQNDLGSGLVSKWYREPSSPPYNEISKHFYFELNQYNQSRQNGNLWNQELNLTVVNLIYNVILIICFIFLLSLFLLKKFKKIVNVDAQLIIIGLLIGNISNSIVTASLANVYDRLQARTSWLIILSTVIIIISNKTYFIRQIKLFLSQPKLD